MSTGTRLPWAAAAAIAQRLHDGLVPVAARVKVAGSIRRRKAEIGDIEIVVEPAAATTGLFVETAPDIESIRRVVASWGEWIKGGDRYMQVRLPEGLNVDVFLAHPPAQFGSILAIRTGPAALGELTVTRMRHRGLRHMAGHVETIHGGIVIDTPTEEDFFRLAGLPCLPPARRDTDAAMQPIPDPDRPECPKCREPMDAQALLYHSTVCSSCRIEHAAGPARTGGMES